MRKRRPFFWRKTASGSWKEISGAVRARSICRDGEYLVFFEVKYRKNADAGFPAEAVGTVKQRKICRTAKYYLYRKHYGESVPVRFDVIAVCAERVNWYQNAFDYMR